MTSIVPADEIEQIVGIKRRRVLHCARLVSSEQTTYILHSETCRRTYADLRNCPYSVALDRGIEPDDWKVLQDVPVAVAVIRGRLFPVRVETRGGAR